MGGVPRPMRTFVQYKMSHLARIRAICLLYTLARPSCVAGSKGGL